MTDDIPTIAVDADIPASASVFSDADRQVRARFAADWVASHLRRLLLKQETVVLGLVGGSSVGDVHELLPDTDVDFSRVLVTQCDERAVPADSAERNWRVIEPLVDPLLADGRLPADNVIALPDLDADASIDQVDAALDVMRARIERVDVALLAAGPDGHCASLFPDHPGLTVTGTFTVVTDSPKPPPVRVSMTTGMLAGAQASLLIGFGEDKAPAMQRIVTAGPLAQAPGRLVHLAEHAVVVTDQPVGTDDAQALTR